MRNLLVLTENTEVANSSRRAQNQRRLRAIEVLEKQDVCVCSYTSPYIPIFGNYWKPPRGGQRSYSYETAIIPLFALWLPSCSFLSSKTLPMAQATWTAPPAAHHSQAQAACFSASWAESPAVPRVSRSWHTMHSTVPSAGELMNPAHWRLQSSPGWGGHWDLLSHMRFATGTIGHQAWQTLALTQLSHYFFFFPSYEEYMSWKRKTKRFWYIHNNLIQRIKSPKRF